MIESSTCIRPSRGGTLRRRHIGHLRPLAAGELFAISQRRVHRQDLGVADRADSPGLGDVAALRATVTSMSITEGGRA
jgi:hypothetical protein